MKHTLLYVFAAAVLLSVAGCSREQKNLFDESAAERLQAQQEAVELYLTTAPNGWEMRYFPYPEAAGYAFLMKFEADGSVKIATKNPVSTKNVYAEETSLWDTDGTQGCILTFNSYNTLFSIFADPGSDGVGHSGDYEFFVLPDFDEKHFNLKGKKHDAYISLNRLSDNQDWEAYFDAIDVYNADIFDDNDGIDMLYWDGEKQKSMTYNKGQFTFEADGEQQERGFIVTPSGIHFYTGFLLADSVTYVKDFDLSEDKQILKTEDGIAFISSNYSAADFFAHKFTKYSRWTYIAEGSDTQTQNAVEHIRQLGLAKGANINRIAYERTVSTNSMGKQTFSYALYVSYLVENKVFGGRIVLDYVNKNDLLTFTYKSHEDALKPLFARLADSQDEAAALFTDIFCGTFTPKSYTGSALNMTQLSLENTSGTSIHVKADKIIF